MNEDSRNEGFADLANPVKTSSKSLRVIHLSKTSSKSLRVIHLSLTLSCRDLGSLLANDVASGEGDDEVEWENADGSEAGSQPSSRPSSQPK